MTLGVIAAELRCRRSSDEWYDVLSLRLELLEVDLRIPEQVHRCGHATLEVNSSSGSPHHCFHIDSLTPFKDF